VHAALEAGASFDSLQRVYHDRAEERELPLLPITQLPASYATALDSVPAGKFSPVFRLDSPVGLLHSKYAIALVTVRTPGGEVR
jgi:hypothetical protein